jgi:peptidoglycan/LPS O-acetylase OafA/YrhL
MDSEEIVRFTDLPEGIERARITELANRPGGRAHAGEDVDVPAKEHLNVAAHGLRGLASLMVVGAHIIGGTARHIYPNDASYVEAVRHPWYLGTFGVELFFVISGFVILPSALKYEPAQFALRRFLRIYPLFFAFSLLFIALNWATNSYGHNNNLESIVSGLLFLNLFTGTEQLTPNAWSLTYEVLFYVLTCAVVHYAFRHRSWVLGSLAIASSLWFVVTFPIALYFLAGVAARLLLPANKLDISIRRSSEAVLFVMMVVLASRGHFEYKHGDFANPVVIPLIIVTGTYFYFAVAGGSLTNAVMDNRVARYVGTVSYSLYIVHPYVYYVLRALFARYHWFTPDAAYSVGIFAVFVVILSIAVTHIVHVTLERTPYQWAFRQRIYSKAPPSPELDAIVAKGERD